MDDLAILMKESLRLLERLESNDYKAGPARYLATNQLAHLPVETILEIASYLCESKDLSNLAQTSRTFWKIVNPLLYLSFRDQFEPDVFQQLESRRYRLQKLLSFGEYSVFTRCADIRINRTPFEDEDEQKGSLKINDKSPNMEKQIAGFIRGFPRLEVLSFLSYRLGYLDTAIHVVHQAATNLRNLTSLKVEVHSDGIICMANNVKKGRRIIPRKDVVWKLKTFCFVVDAVGFSSLEPIEPFFVMINQTSLPHQLDCTMFMGKMFGEALDMVEDLQLGRHVSFPYLDERRIQEQNDYLKYYQWNTPALRKLKYIDLRSPLCLASFPDASLEKVEELGINWTFYEFILRGCSERAAKLQEETKSDLSKLPNLKILHIYHNDTSTLTAEQDKMEWVKRAAWIGSLKQSLKEVVIYRGHGSEANSTEAYRFWSLYNEAGQA